MFNLFKKVFIVLILSSYFSLVLLANPKDASIVSGSITIKQESPTKIGITQTTDKAIINWKSFNIDKNEHTEFYQPNSNSITLNRVISNDSSKILGKLSANSQIMIINQNGILFGKDSIVDVSGLVATTHDINNKDFLNNNFNFSKSGNPNSSIINLGKITIKDYGYSALVAPYVQNKGVIVAKLGKVVLGSTSKFTLDLHGDNLINFIIDKNTIQEAYDLDGNKLTSLIDNQGKIQTNGGYVILKASEINNIIESVVNQSGIIEATNIEEKNGEIILSGGNKGIVSNTGSLIATSSTSTGGRIEITGEKIGLFSGTNINASGKTGGGTVLIGGDYLGGNASPEVYKELGINKEEKIIRTAEYLYIDNNAQIKANSLENGNGGKIILWSDNSSFIYGNIEAKGGKYSGNGGFVETSGKKYLDINTVPLTTSLNGQGGSWLLDPVNITISENSTISNYTQNNDTFKSNWEGNDFTSGICFFCYRGIFDFSNKLLTLKSTSHISSTNENQKTSFILISDIEYALNKGINVYLTTNNDNYLSDGNIYFNKNLNKVSGSDATLTLYAKNNIFINNTNFTSTYNKLNIKLISENGTINKNNTSLNLNNGQLTEITNNSKTLTMEAISSENNQREEIIHQENYLASLNIKYDDKNLFNNPFPNNPKPVNGDYLDWLGYTLKEGYDTTKWATTKYVNSVASTSQEAINEAGKEFNKIDQLRNIQAQNDISSKAQEMGVSVKALMTIAFSPIFNKETGKALKSTNIDEALSKKVTNFANTELGQNLIIILEEQQIGYEEFARQHPELARNIEAGVNLSEVIPSLKAMKTTKKVAIPTKNTNNIDNTQIKNINYTYVRKKSINGYEYEIDNLGRTTEVQAKLKLLKAERNKKNQLNIGGDERLETDVGGHLIGSRFNGSGEVENLIAQNSTINNSGYKKFENKWAKLLEEGKKVEVKLKIIYKGENKRPNGFTITQIVDGKKLDDITILNNFKK